MVTTCAPSSDDSGVTQERRGMPLRCTVQAPHWAMPQPYLVPVSFSWSRSTQSSGVSGSASMSIIKDGALWGLVACHHPEPRDLSLATRLACQSLADLDYPLEKTNIHGGAIALGHPIGASGARLVLTAALELARRGQGRTAVSLCGGGGQGDALLLSL